MKRIAVLVLLASAEAAAATESFDVPRSARLLGDLPQPTPQPRFPHLRPVLMASISATLFGAAATFGILAGGPLLIPLLLAAPLPELFVDVWRGLEVTGIAWGAFAGFLATEESHSPYVKALSHEGLAITLDQGAYAAYAVYRDLRVAQEAPSERDGWLPRYASELVTSPFSLSNLAHPIVLVPAGIWLALQIFSQAVSGPLQRQAPGAIAFNLGIAAGGALDTAIGEECLFRGFIYEETRHAIGIWPARVLNMLLFSAAHLPEYAGSGAGLLITLPELAVLSLLMEIAYDQGGLPESIALHFLFDATGAFVASLYSTSAPRLASLSGRPQGATLTAPLLSFAF